MKRTTTNQTDRRLKTARLAPLPWINRGR